MGRIPGKPGWSHRRLGNAAQPEFGLFPLGKGCWESWEPADFPSHFFFNCFKISLAALAPEPPVNPAPG